MTRDFMLAYFTTAPLRPPEALAMACELGYRAIGVRLGALSEGGEFSPLCEDRSLLRATIGRMKDTGVAIFDVEGIRLQEQFDVANYARLLAVAAELHASVVSVIGYDPVEQRLTDSFAQICEAAALYGLAVALEFIPYSSVQDSNSALQILRNARRPNSRIVIDLLHASWSNMTRADLDAIPHGWIGFAQLCDAPAERPATRDGLIHTARCARLLPGEGGIDVRAWVRQLPSGVPLSIEIPNVERLAVHGPREWSRRALLAARRALDE